MEKQPLLVKYIKPLVLLAVLFGASSSIFARAITASSMAIGFLRLSIGLPFFALPALINKRDEIKALSGKQILGSVSAGVFLATHFFFWFSCAKMTNIASAVVIGALHPLVILVIDLFIIKKHVSAKAIFGIILALVGAAVIAGLDYNQIAAGNFAGDIVALLSAITFGIYFAIGGKVRKTVSTSVHLLICFFSCWVCFALGMIVTKTPVTGYPAKDYLLILAMTILCQIGTHAIFNLSFGYVDPLYVSVTETADPAFAIVFAMIFLNQIPGKWEVLGCAIVVLGLLCYNYYSEKERKT